MKSSALGSAQTGTENVHIPSVLLAFFLIIPVLFTGACTRMVNSHYSDTVMPQEGNITAKGLKEPVTVRRDDMGIPFIEAKSMEDLVFAIGYVNASDRLTQMVTFKLASQGRLSEMAGRSALDLDIFMRTLGLSKNARVLLDNISEEKKAILLRYAAGVNAYMEDYRDRLPPELSMMGYIPEKWEPIDSLSILSLVDLALSFNMLEEINSLIIAQSVGPRNLAWLLPIYPDEPLPAEEAEKIKGLDLKGTIPSIQRVSSTGDMLKSLGFTGIAASNNWVISKERTAGRASILANDTHLMLTMPCLWNMMHIRCRDIDAAGIGLAGLPGIVAGYNGHIAWGMTMVMSDNQDLFLEKLKLVDGKLQYLHKGSWLPVTERVETFIVKGKGPVQVTIKETVHGPLLNDMLANPPKNNIMPEPMELPYGIALSWAAAEPGDRSLDAFFSLVTSRSVQEAVPFARQIQVMALNMVIADRDNIAWQVTGCYPIRGKGRGLLPSPGWTGEYDWKGFLDPGRFPHAVNPPEGYVGTANNKTIGPEYPYVLSSSWYWPDRAERISELITKTRGHTFKTSMDMQLDTHSLSAERVRKLLLEGGLSTAVGQEIGSWKDTDMQKKAGEALAMLKDFDCTMAAGSSGAAFLGAFMHVLTRDVFLDELGPDGSPTWKAFVFCNSDSYSAMTDHLLLRGDESPFWDDIKTPGKETKTQVIARSLAHTMDLLEEELGKDRRTWTWGRLHTYHFMTESSKMAPNLGLINRLGLAALSPYFNRGPFPAPGDHTTLNVSATMIGKDFDTWLIPAMRIVADFSLDEPFSGVNSTGQSDNPSSPNYDDGIQAWIKGSSGSSP